MNYYIIYNNNNRYNKILSFSGKPRSRLHLTTASTHKITMDQVREAVKKNLTVLADMSAKALSQPPS